MTHLSKHEKKNSLYGIKLAVILTICFYTVNAHAQEESLQRPERRGFIFGVALGGGSLIVKDEGLASESYAKASVLNLKLGYMLNNKNAICLHIPSGGHKENEETRAFESILFTGQHWFGKRLWGSAGVGLAMDMPPFYDTENDDPKFYFGTATSLGVGYEIWQSKRFALDVQGRIVYGNYQVESIRRQCTAFDLLIGLNLY